MNTKNKAGLIIGIVVMLGWTVYALISGITGLTKAGRTTATLSAEEGKICETYVTAAAKVYTIEHSLNILIPTGKEHLYLCFCGEEQVPLLVKERESWYNANFDVSGYAKGIVTVTGEVQKLDSQFKSDIEGMNRELVSMGGTNISSTKYISSTYKTKYTLNLVSGLVNIAAAAVMLVMIKRGAGVKAGTVMCIIAVVFMVFVLLCGDTI